MSEATGTPDWNDWVGREEMRRDLAAAAPLAALAATLDRSDAEPEPGADVPPLWHWCWFTPNALQSEIGEDGHPKRGGFLPPVPLPRRMWAGGRLDFVQPIRTGEAITRLSRIESVQTKSGKSGSLVFVTVVHEIAGEHGLAIREAQDIVYRDAPAPGSMPPPAPPAPMDEAFSRSVTPDPVLLFRYSALTFNGHRIHYDRSYATGAEGYPGLVVHGPLIATLLLDLLSAERPDARVRTFAFKAVSPLFDIHRFTVCGRPGAGSDGTVALWARNHEGALAMQASATLA